MAAPALAEHAAKFVEGFNFGIVLETSVRHKPLGEHGRGNFSLHYGFNGICGVRSHQGQ